MFYKMLIPSLISSVGFALSDMADALVVGQRMGETGLAAISLCLPIYMLMNVITDAFGIGGGVRFSCLLGEGNEDEAVRCFNRIWKTAISEAEEAIRITKIITRTAETTITAGDRAITGTVRW